MKVKKVKKKQPFRRTIQIFQYFYKRATVHIEENTFSERINTHKYHPKAILGENLYSENEKKINVNYVISGLLISLLGVHVVCFALNYFINYLMAIKQQKGHVKSILELGGVHITPHFSWIYPTKMNYWILSVLLIIVFTMLFYSKMSYRNPNVAYGQKGDSRLTTLKEIMAQYRSIDDSKTKFSGYGGIPVSHYDDKYYIDVDTVNTCVLGASRSGKGEMIVIPLIDNLSRAEKQSNMVLNDPKAEILSASKKTLEKRGYNIVVLNIDEPLLSMSYNPLQFVVDAYAQGDIQESAERANTFTNMLFASGKGTDNEYFYKSAQDAVTAIIMTIIEYCFKNDCIEKITMFNVAQMLNELGTLFYVSADGREVNALDEYFKTLPADNIAKLKYGSTSFSGDKAKGSIMSTASQCISMFTSESFGKMTSKSSIDLKQIGFPKSVEMQFDESMFNERVIVRFYKRLKTGEFKLINNYKVKVKALGITTLNFDEDLSTGDLLKVSLLTDPNKSNIYQIKLSKNKKTKIDLKVKLVGSKKNNLTKLQRIDLKYNDKPIALFMLTPDWNSANHIITSIFIKQLYTTLASNCKETKEKKCFRRVHFILDEAGNMPAIEELDKIMTVCLGRNIIFDLFLQSYQQLETLYDKASATIKENCQNHMLIVSTDPDSIEELSKKAGNTTDVSKSSNEKRLDPDNGINKNADQNRILTNERLSQMLEGEMLVIRTLHRQDLNHKKVRPYPIFNYGETNLPYRWQILNDDFDTSTDLNDIDLDSEHYDFDLKANQISFSSFIIDKATRKKYDRVNSDSATPEEESKTLADLIGAMSQELSEEDLDNSTGLTNRELYAKKLMQVSYLIEDDETDKLYKLFESAISKFDYNESNLRMNISLLETDIESLKKECSINVSDGRLTTGIEDLFEILVNILEDELLNQKYEVENV